jgi:hypothetical protein
MSWWDDGPNVLGDGPADLLKAAWRRILARRAAAAERKPTLDETLRAFARALRAAPLDKGFRQLELHAVAQPPAFFDGNAPAPADLVDAFEGALQAVAEDYQRSLQRPPSPNEAVRTLQFVVGANPSVYLTDPIDPTFWDDAMIRVEES